MSEFTYQGYCEKCGKRTTFWGGSTWAICDECETRVESDELKHFHIIGML